VGKLARISLVMVRLRKVQIFCAGSDLDDFAVSLGHIAVRAGPVGGRVGPAGGRDKAVC